jgi:SNF2 family DNA or RNA helicase
MSELWPFQVAGVKFLQEHKRVILADQMGIGKTRQVIEVLKERVQRDSEISILVVCAKKNAMLVWERELIKWAPELAEDFGSTEGKSASKRLTIWTHGLRVIATHQVMLRDKKTMPLKWDIIVIDEPQTWLRNRKTKSFKFMKTFRSEFLILMSGTPATRGAQDLWPMLNLINRKVFSSYWRFVSSFCYVDDTQWGKDVYGTRNKDALKDLLSRYMIRRLKAEVFLDMPPKLVDTVPIRMSDEQEKAHTELLENLLTMLAGELVMTPNILTCVLRLRQLLVCPRLLNPEAGLGAGIEYLQTMTAELILGGEEDACHFVVFTPFKKALLHIGEALQKVGAKVGYLYGGMSTKELGAAIDKFNEERSVLVCVIKYAEAFSLASACTAYFLGAEWDPMEDEQAEDRMHRVETVETVNIHYLQYIGSVEERVMEVLSTKYAAVGQFLTDARSLQKLLFKKETRS